MFESRSYIADLYCSLVCCDQANNAVVTIVLHSKSFC